MNKHSTNNEPEDNSRVSMKDVYQDLKDTRKSVSELIRYRVALMDSKEHGTGTVDAEKMKEYKGKAIDAINNLFNDED